MMIVTSSAIKNGYFDDKYGKRGNDTEKKVPLLSFPFEIAEEPEGTVSYAWILEDEDAVPVAGFSWIHWMAANVRKKFIPEDFSRQNKDAIQGENTAEHDTPLRFARLCAGYDIGTATGIFNRRPVPGNGRTYS